VPGFASHSSQPNLTAFLRNSSGRISPNWSAWIRSAGTSSGVSGPPQFRRTFVQRIEICLPKNGVEKNVSFDLSLHVTLNAFCPKALLKKQPQLEKSKTSLVKRYQCPLGYSFLLIMYRSMMISLLALVWKSNMRGITKSNA
jgi:hypothetical protein